MLQFQEQLCFLVTVFVLLLLKDGEKFATWYREYFFTEKAIMKHSDNLAWQIAGKIRNGLDLYATADGSLFSGRRLAAEFGVSHQTVCRAIQLLAGENLLECKRGTRAVVRKKSKRINLACMISTDYTNAKPGGYSDVPYQVKILLDELERCQCEYRIFNFYDLKHANFSPRIFAGFDGLIAARAFSDINSRQLVNDFPGPKVWLWNNEAATDSGNQVIPDFLAGYVELFDRARRHGIRKCVLHCSRKFFANIMTDALELNNWAPQDFSVVMHNAPETQLAAYKYALNLPVEKTTLHACASDMFACGLAEAFLDRKFKPGEFHVSGTGDIESCGFMPFDKPFLTTLHTDRREVISKGLDCLIRKITDGGNSPEEIIRIRTGLVVRDSALKEDATLN